MDLLRVIVGLTFAMALNPIGWIGLLVLAILLHGAAVVLRAVLLPLSCILGG